MRLELSERETEVLASVVQDVIRESQAEVCWTELSELLRQVRAREAVLRGILERLTAVEAR